MVKTNNEEKAKFSMTELVKKLDEIINENRDNLKLINYIREQFITKGLLYQIPQQVFSDGWDLENLESIELIQFTKSVGMYFKDKSLDIVNYFSNGELIFYNSYIPIEEEAPNFILFKNAIKINAKSYVAVLTAKQASEMRRYRQYIYYKPTQRPARNVLSKGRKVGTKENINQEGVKDLTERFIKKDIFPTQIAWGVLYYEGKKLGISFNGYKDHEEVGDLKIYPTWYTEDINYTPFVSNDGYHRYISLANAFDKHLLETGEELDISLTTVINIMTEAEAKQYVQDSFKRNYADLKELEAMSPTSENKFIDIIIDKSEVLKGKVETTFKNIKTTNALTSKDILSSAIKISKFDINDDIEADIQSTKIAKIIDLIINRLCKEYFNNSIKEMKETYLLAPNMFIGYLAIVDFLKNDNKYINKIVKIVDELYLLTEDKNIATLKLNNKNCNTDIVYRYFQNLIIEVI